MQRFGSQCSVLEAKEQILGKEDPDAAAAIKNSLELDGVVFHTKCKIVKVDMIKQGDTSQSPWPFYEVTRFRHEPF